MAKKELVLGELGGGVSEYTWIPQTSWPSAGPAVISTTKRAKAFVITDSNSQIWCAVDGDTVPNRNGSQVTGFTLTWENDKVTIVGAYGANASFRGYYIT